jgi:hypothetical protein
MKSLVYLCSVVVTALALPVTAQMTQRAGGEGISTYVGLNKNICKRIASRGKSRDRNDPEVWQCGRLVDGWRVAIDSADLRAPIALRRDGNETKFNLYDATGGTSGVLGKRFEFRMRSGKAIGAIVRWNTASASPLGATPSTFVVARLSPTACVIAVVPPGPHQSTAARALADASAGKPCLGKP